MRRALAVVVAVGLALAVPGLASAHRVASRSERGGMLNAAHQTLPGRCVVADIATVVKGSQWGAFAFNSHARGGCRRFGFNGVTIEHKVNSRWRVVWEGSSGKPKNVPGRVYRDLNNGLRSAF